MAMDTSPHTYRFLPADIFTSGYRVVGKIMVSNTGTMGMLNDSTHSSMEVHDARLARLHMPTKLVDHFELVRMMKDHVYAVCMARREDLGSAGFGARRLYQHRRISRPHHNAGV